MKRALAVTVIGVLLSIFYICLGVYEQSLGFKFLESLFLSDRLQLLFSNDLKTLELFYFTYPSLSQLLAIPAAVIDPLLAPMITSSVAVGFFSAHIINELFRKNLKTISVLVSIYVMCSPIVLSVATSGTSLYLYLILYYFFFNFLFRYTRDYTTYNFVIVSLCLTFFVLLDYEFLWIIIFMIPILFLFSLFNSRGIQKSYIGIFQELTQSRDSTKELIRKSLSTILVIVFTPILSLGCFLIINYWFTGDFLFFSSSKTTSWDHNPLMNAIFYGFNITDFYITNQWSYLVISCMALSPPFFVAFFIGRKKLLFHLILCLVPLWITYKVNSNPLELLTLKDLLIISASGIAAFLHLFETRLFTVIKNSRILYIMSFLLFIFNLCGEYYYLNNSNIDREQNMLAFFKQDAPKNTNAVAALAEYLTQNIPEGANILTDNTQTYNITALTRSQITYVDQFDSNYYDALQAPELYADYILIVNEFQSNTIDLNLESVFYDFDKTYPIVYQNKVFSLLKAKH